MSSGATRGAAMSPQTPQDFSAPPPPPLSSSTPPKRQWKGWYTAVIVLVIVALLGSSLGAFLVLRNKTNQTAVVHGGQAFLLSSGQLDPVTAQGIADQLQIQLQNIPDPH